MFTLELELTKNCNLNCQYCFVKNKGNSRLTFDKAKEHIRFGLNYADQFKIKDILIAFTGGEVLLEFTLIKEIIQYLEKEKYNEYTFQYSFVTNGVLFNQETKKYMEEKNVEITLSLDGNKDTQDKERRMADGNGSYELIEKNFENFLAYSGDFYINMIILPDNVMNLADNFIFMIKKGFKSIRTYLEISGIWAQAEIELLGKQLKLCADYYYDINIGCKKYSWNYIDEGMDSILNKKLGSSCGAGVIIIHIGINGNIRCCGLYEDVGGIGTIETGIDKKKVADYDDRFKAAPDKCKTCETYYYCAQKKCLFSFEQFKDERIVDKYCHWYKFRYILSKEIIEKLNLQRLVEKSKERAVKYD